MTCTKSDFLRSSFSPLPCLYRRMKESTSLCCCCPPPSQRVDDSPPPSAAAGRRGGSEEDSRRWQEADMALPLSYSTSTSCQDPRMRPTGRQGEDVRRSDARRKLRWRGAGARGWHSLGKNKTYRHVTCPVGLPTSAPSPRWDAHAVKLLTADDKAYRTHCQVLYLCLPARQSCKAD